MLPHALTPARRAVPCLDDIRIGLRDERADARQRLAAPVAELHDARVDEVAGGGRCSFFLRGALAFSGECCGDLCAQ